MREAWSFDMQNVGEAAVVNADVLSDENIVCVCASFLTIRLHPITGNFSQL